MNRFFHREEYRREFPRRAYARLDDIEPIVPGPDAELTFVFDAVDADWNGFDEGGLFNLSDPDLETRIASYWRGQFGRDGGRGPDEPDGYGQVPIYRIEFSISPDKKIFEQLPRNEERWISLELSNVESDTPVDVYGGLFAPPIRAYLHAVPATAPSGPLSTLFDMTTWIDSSHAELIEALRPQCELEALACFDIGQGSASALICRCGIPIYYFDTGRGSGRNAPTAPAVIDFCTCWSPTVILSHWDTDHWAGASGHTGLQACKWIVPRQTISTTHTVFANEILNAGGKIHVVGNGTSPLTWSSGQQDYDLRRATGTGRNGSGLVLIVTDRTSRRSWVLTGDAGYDLIAQGAPNDIAAMVVPHHGADMGASSQPFLRSSNGYARLFYSFGPGNGHGPKTPPVRHPVAAAVTAHQNRNWKHGNWAPNTAGQSLAGGDVLATATHTFTHLQGGVAGWNGPPTSLGHLNVCNHAMPVPQS
ncbi:MULTISPECIES: hypothetical protein [Bacteria]|uniref:Metal-dependent hydrolase, beta-lactamase superfamily II n=2 Tax=Bacteria TaxID=2 RepID=A0AAU9AEQ6_LYSEN|nr:hypothetical protein [Lysobacter enzymogenes]BAV95740.1 conserved hypothetical protein [Lysobacter enzymogenes]